MIIGPDAFLCVPGDPRFASHSRLNELLREQAADPTHAHPIAGAAVKRLAKTLSKQELVDLALTAFDRAVWIGEHAHELAHTDAWRGRLANILYHLYGLRLPFSAADVCRLIGGRNGTAPPVGCLVEYGAARDLTPDLCVALRQLRDRYQAGVGRDHPHAAVQTQVQLLDMLLWHDETHALDLAACWSERVRHGFRSMTGERKSRWRALLRHIRGDAGSKPPKPWVKDAERRLAAVETEDFRATIADWFACFREPQPLRLSVVGSHVLKGLLWYCALARDPAVTDAALALLDTTWKPKRNLDKVMVALSVLIDSMPVEEAWARLLRLQQAWGASQGRIERLLIKMGAAFGLSEEQLRQQGLLKPEPAEATAKSRPTEWLVAVAMPQSAEELLAALRRRGSL